MKVAACFARSGVDCVDVVRRMAQAQRLHDSQGCQLFAVEGGAFGCVLASEQRLSTPLLRQGRDGNLLMVTGLPIHLEGSLEARLEGAVAGDFRGAARALADLDGAFAALFWDVRNRKLVVVTDALGMQPLYVWRGEGVHLLATEVKAFPASGLVSVEMDPAGWGGFISLGFAVGGRTQLAGVTRVEAASRLTYDIAGGTLDSQVHWTWPAPRADMRFEDVDTGHLLGLLRREVAGYAAHCSTAPLLLSGGFDSRLILALLNEGGFRTQALILDHRDELLNADGQYARRIANRLNGGHYEVVRPSDRFYDSPAFLRYLVMNEVAVPSVDLFIAQASSCIRPEMQGVWDGLGPGFVFAPSYPHPGGFSAYLEDRCRGFESPEWQSALAVFSRPTTEGLYAAFREVLDREMGKYADDEFGVAQFQVMNQMRRRISLPPLQVYANLVLPLTPGLSRALWDLAASLPHPIVYRGRLYLHLFATHFPEAMRVPICSGGTVVSRRRFAPGLWARRHAASARRRLGYYGRRLLHLPVVGSLCRTWGAGPGKAGASRGLVDRVIDAADPGYAELSADAVQALKCRQPPYDGTTTLSRHLLFHWQVWRWVMEGRLTVGNAAEFVADVAAGGGKGG